METFKEVESRMHSNTLKKNEIQSYIREITEAAITKEIYSNDLLHVRSMDAILRAVKFLIYASGTALILYAISFIITPFIYTLIIKWGGPEIVNSIEKLIQAFKS